MQRDFAAFHQFGAFFDGLSLIVLFDDVVLVGITHVFQMVDIQSARFKAANGFAQRNAFGVRKAPTLIVPKADGGNDVFENASNIKGYIESLN